MVVLLELSVEALICPLVLSVREWLQDIGARCHILIKVQRDMLLIGTYYVIYQTYYQFSYSHIDFSGAMADY